MGQVVYTNYWINKRAGIKKEHGSYLTEEDAIKGIETWWDIHKAKYKEIIHKRTNSGALEILYGDDRYFYRIEKREIDGKLPSTTYKLKSSGEIHALRLQHHLRDEMFLFDELSEPYRDRLIVTMADVPKIREYVYTKRGEPIIKISEIKQLVH